MKKKEMFIIGNGFNENFNKEGLFTYEDILKLARGKNGFNLLWDLYVNFIKYFRTHLKIDADSNRSELIKFSFSYISTLLENENFNNYEILDFYFNYILNSFNGWNESDLVKGYFNYFIEQNNEEIDFLIDSFFEELIKLMKQEEDAGRKKLYISYSEVNKKNMKSNIFFYLINLFINRELKDSIIQLSIKNKNNIPEYPFLPPQKTDIIWTTNYDHNLSKLFENDVVNIHGSWINNDILYGSPIDKKNNSTYYKLDFNNFENSNNFNRNLNGKINNLHIFGLDLLKETNLLLAIKEEICPEKVVFYFYEKIDSDYRRALNSIFKKIEFVSSDFFSFKMNFKKQS